MTVTNDIIRGERNKEYLVPIDEILTWYPGDFYRQDDCVLYHKCQTIDSQWYEILEIVESDHRYTDIYKALKTNGFVAALGAKVTEDDHVILLDGHHRVSVALALQIKEVPVYVAGPEHQIEDLIALDSGWWTKRNPPWTTILGK